MTNREKFEALIKERFGDCISLAICKNSDGDYLNWDAQVAWFAYQAALASQQPTVANEGFNLGHFTQGPDFTPRGVICTSDNQASRRPEDDGWIDWAGGECPLAESNCLEVKFRSGQTDSIPAVTADTYEWMHGGCFSDIIAYRVVKP